MVFYEICGWYLLLLLDYFVVLAGFEFVVLGLCICVKLIVGVYNFEIRSCFCFCLWFSAVVWGLVYTYGVVDDVGLT